MLLTYDAISLTLPDALDWIDEIDWSPVEQTHTYTTSGALLIEEALKKAGRPITLQGSEDRTWCTRELVMQLRAMASIPGIVLTLTIRGESRSVTFNHVKGALQGLPLMFCADGSVADDDIYVPSLRLLEL